MVSVETVSALNSRLGCFEWHKWMSNRQVSTASSWLSKLSCSRGFLKSNLGWVFGESGLKWPPQKRPAFWFRLLSLCRVCFSHRSRQHRSARDQQWPPLVIFAQKHLAVKVSVQLANSGRNYFMTQVIFFRIYCLEGEWGNKYPMKKGKQQLPKGNEILFLD